MCIFYISTQIGILVTPPLKGFWNIFVTMRLEIYIHENVDLLLLLLLDPVYFFFFLFLFLFFMIFFSSLYLHLPVVPVHT